MTQQQTAELLERLKNNQLTPEEKLEILKDMNTSLEDFHIMMREMIDGIRAETERQKLAQM